MSSSSSSKTESEQHTTPSSTSNNTRMKYTIERKWMLVKDFKEQDKNYIQFASENKIPRQTFKRWIDEADRIEDKVQHFPARRFRTRESTRPELDRILIAWYNDMRTNNRTYPITRALILDKAIHFQKILDHLTDNRPIQAADSSPADQTDELEDNAKLFEPSDILDEDLQKYVPPPQTSSDLPAAATEPTQTESQTQTTPNYSVTRIPPSGQLHKPSHPGRGIINHYNKCYAIAIIQQLHNIAEFREIILSADVEHLPESDPVKVCLKLKRLFQDLDDIHNPKPATIEDFFNTFSEATEGLFMPGVQADAAEFLLTLLDLLTDDIMPAAVSHPIHDLFYYTMVQQYICPAGHILEELQVSRLFPIPLAEGETLEATLFKLKYGDVMRTYRCSKCHNQSYRDRAISRTLYIRNPKILIFHLQRFGLKNRTTTVTKKYNYLLFPVDTPLFMKPFSKAALASEEATITGVSLYQMICTGLKMWGVHNQFIPLLPPSLPSSSPTQRIQHAELSQSGASHIQPLTTLPTPPSAVVNLDDYDDFGDQITQSQRANTTYSLRLRSGRDPEEYARLDSGLPGESSVIHSPATPSPTLPVDDDESEGMYTLIGVVAHIGPYGSGHYTSYIRKNPAHKNSWIRYNDTQVSTTWHGLLPKELFGLKRQSAGAVYADERKVAYLLFYKQTEMGSLPFTPDVVSDADTESDQMDEQRQTSSSSSSSSSSSLSPAPLTVSDSSIGQSPKKASGGESNPPAEVCFCFIDKAVSFLFYRNRSKSLRCLLRVSLGLPQQSPIRVTAEVEWSRNGVTVEVEWNRTGFRVQD